MTSHIVLTVVGSDPAYRRPRTLAMVAFCLLAAIGFAALGAWQLERRTWKHALIARVESRLAAAPVPAPAPPDWPRITRDRDEYRRVRVTGRFLPDRDTLVGASTVLGPGYWLLAPLHDDRGFTVLVNRGFVPSRGPWPSAGAASITGLLRPTEPDGDLLRSNAPTADRWYSRDIPAIAHARRLGPVAPYFIDTAAMPGSAAYPRGGLTVIAFSDNHLIYALTWFALTALSAGAGVYVIRSGLGQPASGG